MPSAASSSSAQLVPSGGGSLGELYSKCVQMVNENKVSVKNAFDLHLIDHMDDIVDSFMGAGKSTRVSKGGTARVSEEGENRFHEASCTIEASARIYACRVDCVHTDTYRVLGGLNSADLADEADEGQAAGEEGKVGATKRRRMCGVNTLEKNEANITQNVLEADEQSDPMFRRMAAAFDAGGAKGLLLSHLPVVEDLSLIFNGDVPMVRAASSTLFENPKRYAVDSLGLGDPAATSARIAGARLCSEADPFRADLLGEVEDYRLPQRIEDLLRMETGSRSAVGPLAPVDPVPLTDVEEPDCMEADAFGGDIDAELPSTDHPPMAMAPLMDQVPPLPLADVGPGVDSVAQPVSEDAVSFDELFDKFCGKGSTTHQFAYFDECWAKLPRDKDGKGLVPLMDTPYGQLVAQDGHAPRPEKQEKEKPAKRALFDLSDLDKPLKPIQTEPSHKHQLSERAMQWQLRRDVPPYMIDRITMPSWPTWSRGDFACLGLRPHLMLKLVRKPAPSGEGPHSFSDLFSTVVVENPDAFPWLGGGSARGSMTTGAHGEDEEDGRDREADLDDADDDDYGANGLPAHLDFDPQELFLRPDDKVVPDSQGADVGSDFPTEMPDHDDMRAFGHSMDFDLVEQPKTVGAIEIGYSRNSKFVDVKLVKKHLWDCISQDIEGARTRSQSKSESSFQNLVHRTVERLPKAETENLSTAVCFICALHLCNEKGLELVPQTCQGDFNVVGPA